MIMQKNMTEFLIIRFRQLFLLVDNFAQGVAVSYWAANLACNGAKYKNTTEFLIAVQKSAFVISIVILSIFEEVFSKA